MASEPLRVSSSSSEFGFVTGFRSCLVETIPKLSSASFRQRPHPNNFYFRFEIGLRQGDLIALEQLFVLLRSYLQ